MSKAIPFAVAMILLSPSKSFGQDQPPLKATPCSSSMAQCLQCHQESEASGKLKNFGSVICDDSCLKCHKSQMGEHHVVGKTIEKKEDVARLVFLGGQRLSCITCHDMKNKRYDSRSWKSQSLFGRVFSRKSKHKTFYLRINNSSGALCKSCH